MSFCRTLDSKEICSGLGEMMHYFLVDGSIEPINFIDTIKAAKNDISILQSLVWKSLSIKKKMIELDEFDQGPRNVFNYGHNSNQHGNLNAINGEGKTSQSAFLMMLQYPTGMRWGEAAALTSKDFDWKNA